MPIRFFELLGAVLHDRIAFCAQHQGMRIEQIHQQILSEAERNQAEWYSDRIPNLHYNEPTCRLAYLYIVAAANANCFKWILEHNSNLRAYVRGIARTRRQLRICAFGAGPGTELMAVAKWLEEQNLGHCVQTDFQLLDIVQEWQDTWYGLRDHINEHLRNHYGQDFGRWPLIPAGNFVAQDVRDIACIRRLGQVWNQDLYVVSFLLSELFRDDPAFRAFIAAITERAPKGARFVFIERRGARWKARMRTIARDAGLVLSPFAESCEELDQDEDPASLGAVYRHLSNPASGGRRPRNGWDVVYCVGVKQ